MNVLHHIMNSLVRNKKVSILLCFYERPSFLPLIVNNLKTQSFVKNCSDNVELIIVDDSSIDMCLNIELLKSELKDHINDVTYIRSDEKLTIGEKRNLLIRSAKYSAVIFMDDDDYYFPSYIEYSLFELYKRRKVLVGSNCMLFCYVDHNFKKISISCMSPRQIHEATMCMLKSHWEITGGFNERGNGEGAKLIDGHETKVNCKLDISKLMVCVCHSKNTCNKDMFLKLGTPADYPFSDETKALVEKCVHAQTRVRICFKYATRKRPDQFKSTLETYLSLLSRKHDYHFVISMDSDDDTMNTEDMKTYLNTMRRKIQLEYYYGVSKNKIDAINRDMIAPTFDILVLISDDMIPQVQDYDDIIVQNFKKSFPDYDGMLNFNDGYRNDWPKLCTLTIYGYKYYQRFGYIYNPEYESVYCDNEQTEVGRLLERICDIDRVIIRHEWSAIQFQDELRKSTENPEVYKRDESVYLRRKSVNFDLKRKRACLLTMIIVTNTSIGLKEKIEEMEALGLNVQVHYSTDSRIFTFSYIHRLTFIITTPYLSFCFMNEKCLPEYFSSVHDYLNKNTHTDALFFDQICSLDKGITNFTINSDMNNPNDTIPPQGPWQPIYKRSLTNWTIYKSSVWQRIVPTCDENEFMKQLINNIKVSHSLQKTIYSYVV